MICRKCQTPGIKVKFHYEDSLGRRYNAGICPDCNYQEVSDLTSCKICDRLFDKKSDNHLYCSKPCKAKAGDLKKKN